MGKWTRRAFISSGVLAGGAVIFGVAIRRGNPVGDVEAQIGRENETLLNIWLRIGADNSTTIFVPHAEMGQGIHTTLAMMLADELDADWNKVTVKEAPSNRAYASYPLAKRIVNKKFDIPDFLVDTVDGILLFGMNKVGMQITGGSTSVAGTGELAMRVGGAAARAVLLTAAAQSWGVNVDELTTTNSFIEHVSSNRRAPFAEFAMAAAALKQSTTPTLKTPDQFKLMGTSVPRVDLPGKVDGSAAFGIDMSLPGMKYAAINAAPVFGASVVSVDDEAARTMPGVVDVVSLGNAVAVIADGYWIAKQALQAVNIQWSDAGSNNVTQDKIFKQFIAAMDLANEHDDNEPDFAIGDVASAMSAASRVVEAEYRVPYLAHATMEPMNCTAWFHGDRYELWCGTQNPLGFGIDVAAALDVDRDTVIVHNQYLGGGFGRRTFSDIAVQAARIAADQPFPVKLIWSREEDMRQDFYRQASISRFTGALSESGEPTAWLNQYVDKYEPDAAPHIPYDIGNQLIHYAPSETHVPWGFWRSVDHSLHGFFKESFVDELAVAANKDSYEFRRELLQNRPRLLAVLDHAAKKADWGTPLPEGVGRGIAISASFGSIVAQVVEAEIINGSVRANRVVCAVDAGYTVHPDGMRGQMESGIIYGLTAALYGDISIKDGAVEQSNFHDYPMVRMHEAPRIETHIINSGERVGGAGEPATPAIAPALANAVFDATGIRIRELPMKNARFPKRDLPAQDIA